KLTREFECRIEYARAYRGAFGLFHLDIRLDAAAAVYVAPRVGAMRLALRFFAVLAVVRVIFVDRQTRIIALNRSTARRVVLRRGKRQTRSVWKRKYGLHQSFSEAVLADDQSAVVILHRSGDYLRRGCAAAINQDYKRHVFGR